VQWAESPGFVSLQARLFLSVVALPTRSLPRSQGSFSPGQSAGSVKLDIRAERSRSITRPYTSMFWWLYSHTAVERGTFFCGVPARLRSHIHSAWYWFMACCSFSCQQSLRQVSWKSRNVRAEEHLTVTHNLVAALASFNPTSEISAVTIYTTCFNDQHKSAFCPQTVFMFRTTLTANSDYLLKQPLTGWSL
jgi:hypothetical protein